MTSKEEADDEESKNLLYFDMVSIWFAPIELQLDSEVVIRTLRIVNAVKHEISHNNLAQGKDKIDFAEEIGETAEGIEVYSPLLATKKTSELYDFSRLLRF